MAQKDPDVKTEVARSYEGRGGPDTGAGVGKDVLSAIEATERVRSRRASAGTPPKDPAAPSVAAESPASRRPGPGYISGSPYRRNSRAAAPRREDITPGGRPANGRNTASEAGAQTPARTASQTLARTGAQATAGAGTRTPARTETQTPARTGAQATARARNITPSGSARNEKHASGTAAERAAAAEARKREAERSAAAAARKREAEKAAKAAEREAEARRRSEERRAAAERRRAYLAGYMTTVKTFAAPFFISLFGILAAVVLISVIALAVPREKSNTLMNGKIVYTLGGTTRKKADASEFLVGGTVYADFSAVAKLAGLSVSGDRNVLDYTSESGERAVFRNGSDTAVINGTRYEMEGPALISRSDLKVPLSFVSACMSGIDVKIDRDAVSGLISGISITLSEDGGAVPGFLLKADDTLSRIPVGNVPGSLLVTPGFEGAYEFVNDLSSYAKYMDPKDRDSCLLLINGNRRIDDKFSPGTLTKVVNAKKGLSIEMTVNAEKSLEAMFVEMYAAGFRDVFVNRAYRSYSTQKKSFDNFAYNERYYYRYNFEKTGKYFSDAAYSVLGKAYLNSTYISKGKFSLTASDAQLVASSYCTFPGTSDHHTGMAADLWGEGGEEAFGSTEAYAWLTANAYKFGFIERFPEGKEKVTGSPAEPSHWRFVGQYHAAAMHESGLCLEEYISSLGGPG